MEGDLVLTEILDILQVEGNKCFVTCKQAITYWWTWFEKDVTKSVATDAYKNSTNSHSKFPLDRYLYNIWSKNMILAFPNSSTLAWLPNLWMTETQNGQLIQDARKWLYDEPNQHYKVWQA